jgi:GTP-binding protein HflX
VDRAEHGKLKRIYVSAQNKEGLDALIEVMGESLGNEIVEENLLLKPKETALRAKLYQRGAVLSETIDDEGNYQLRVRLPKREIEKLF